MTDNWTPSARTTFQPRRKPVKPPRAGRDKRNCGSCSLCCKIMEVVPEVKPDNHDWCKHALPGSSCGGCGIYATRPDPCRDFHCQWLIDSRHPQYWFPARSKIIINATVNSEGKKFITFIVDPDYPNRWREPPYFADIKVVARAGIDGLLGEKWTTVVMIKDEKIPIIGSAKLLRVRE